MPSASTQEAAHPAGAALMVRAYSTEAADVVPVILPYVTVPVGGFGNAGVVTLPVQPPGPAVLPAPVTVNAYVAPGASPFTVMTLPAVTWVADEGSAGTDDAAYEVAGEPGSSKVTFAAVEPSATTEQVMTGGYGRPCAVSLLGAPKSLEDTSALAPLSSSAPVELTEKVRLPVQGANRPGQNRAVIPEKSEE
jgi:hypothetical protein